MAYPDIILKGIPNEQFINKDGLILSHLFEFKDKTENRIDNCLETSITWKDNEEAVELLLNQKKEGELQFKAGAVTIKRSDIDRIKKLPMVKSKFSYERARIENNPYHGNLLVSKDSSKQLIKYIAINIALHCEEIIPPKNILE